MITASICLTDIPKETITASEKNGKKYLNIIIDTKKETDRFGNTHAISISQSKEQRERKENKVYIGNGKEYVYGGSKPAANTENSTPTNEQVDNLPF